MLSAPLLTTKLQIPPQRLELVTRSLLIDCLNAGLSGKLILISAPAGFGKTTLVVADWPANALPNAYSGRIEAILITLINEIAAQEQPLIFGLDDCHEITHPEIHTALEFLIQNLPANTHLAIVTREDPQNRLQENRVEFFHAAFYFPSTFRPFG